MSASSFTFHVYFILICVHVIPSHYFHMHITCTCTSSSPHNTPLTLCRTSLSSSGSCSSPPTPSLLVHPNSIPISLPPVASTMLVSLSCNHLPPPPCRLSRSPSTRHRTSGSALHVRLVIRLLPRRVWCATRNEMPL